MTTSPTVTEAKVWSPDSLHRAADGWERAAVSLQTQVDGVVRGVDATVDLWTGTAADAMRDDARAVTTTGTLVAECLLSAAVLARQGADRIGQARTVVLDLVDDAYALGCTVADDGTVTASSPNPLCAQMTVDIATALTVLGETDADVAEQIRDVFDSPATKTTQAGASGWTVPAADIVAGWPTLSQDRIAAQIAALTPEQRRQLVTEFPQQVGNTDGVPWDMRMAANRLNIANAVVEQQNLLAASDEDKLLAIAADQPGLLWTLQTNADARRTALAGYDAAAEERISFYSDLLGKVTDPTGQSTEMIDRQIIAFDPARSSFVELTGNLETSSHIGVFVPGVNTTVLSSGSNLDTTRRIVEAGRGEVAMLTYVGGPFPDAGTVSEYPNAADNSYATAMAPRLVAFTEDVNRVADSLGEDVSVTVIGHSYGGSILGTAESMGLTADRTLYIAAAGAGVGVDDPSDWHNGNPDVVRYAMTAPGDWIQMLQGSAYGLGPHGADVDEMPGVIRLETGNYADGTPVQGWDAHSDIVNEPSDAWNNMLAVITGSDVTTAAEPQPVNPWPLPFDPTDWWPIDPFG